MCSYGQLSEVQMLRDLDVDLESSQGHINIHSTCRTTSLPNYVTVASRTTEIWPFEFREIWTFGEVWTLVIAFLEENSKIGLRQSVVHDSSHVIIINHQFWAPRQNGEGDRAIEKCNFRNFGSSVTLTLTWGRVEVTLVRICGRDLPTHQIRSRSKKNFLWTYGRTYGRTHLSSNLLGHT